MAFYAINGGNKVLVEQTDHNGAAAGGVGSPFSVVPYKSLEDQIAAISDYANNELPQVKSEWVELYADVAGIAGDGARRCFVDPISGDDNNDGLTTQTAVKTLSKAASFSRWGMGLLNITLMNDTPIDGNITFKSGMVQFSALSRSTKLISAGNRFSSSFLGCKWLLFNLTIHLTKKPANGWGHMLTTHGDTYAMIFDADIEIDDDADIALFQNVHLISFIHQGIVLVNPGTSMDGRWIENFSGSTFPSNNRIRTDKVSL